VALVQAVDGFVYSLRVLTHAEARVRHYQTDRELRQRTVAVAAADDADAAVAAAVALVAPLLLLSSSQDLRTVADQDDECARHQKNAQCTHHFSS